MLLYLYLNKRFKQLDALKPYLQEFVTELPTSPAEGKFYPRTDHIGFCIQK
jgi:hypothetical protein